MRWSPFLGIPLVIALISFLFFKIFPLSSLISSPPPLQPRLFSAEELSFYNGSDPQLPIYLAIVGSVFDVTKGKSHYGAGGGYNHFAGRDASRAFVSGNFTGDGLTDSLQGLSSPELVTSYFISLCFTIARYVGKLDGRYYDSKGNPTKYLKGVEAKAARGAQLLEKQKDEEAKVPSCNSRWSQDEGSEVWCDDGYPRLVQRPIEIALTGKMSKRCACYKEDELEQAGLEVYEGCDFFAKKCRI
nr:membrane-associated progesterone-binding protein 4-like isoform X2 [Coffea arabica]